MLQCSSFTIVQFFLEEIIFYFPFMSSQQTSFFSRSLQLFCPLSIHPFLYSHSTLSSLIIFKPTQQSRETVEYTMDQNKKEDKRQKWTKQQDQFLKNLKEIDQVQSWKDVAALINQKFPSIQRNSKQCRDRYVNYLKNEDVDKSSTDWSPSENHLLYQKYAQLGSKWVQIAQYLQTKYRKNQLRSENKTKNKFYNSLRKFHRKLNETIKQKLKLKRKPIKYELLIKLLQIQKILRGSSTQFTLDLRSKSFAFQSLRIKTIEAIEKNELGDQEDNLECIVFEILLFAKETKFLTPNKGNICRKGAYQNKIREQNLLYIKQNQMEIQQNIISKDNQINDLMESIINLSEMSDLMEQTENRKRSFEPRYKYPVEQFQDANHNDLIKARLRSLYFDDKEPGQHDFFQ